MIINDSYTKNFYGTEGTVTVDATVVKDNLQQVVLASNKNGITCYFNFNSLKELDDGIEALTSMRNRLLQEELR